MNPNQLSTLEEARKIAAQLTGIGGGIKAIYIPQYEGPYSAPESGTSKFFHFLFTNGAQGFNVGLIRTLQRQCPTSWLGMVTSEVGYQAKVFMPPPDASEIDNPISPAEPAQQKALPNPIGPSK